MKHFTRFLKKGMVAVAALLVCAPTLTVQAQNVTIKATNGSMIASTPTGSTDYDTFFKCGGFATWQHEQLTMALTASDATTLTDYGQLSNPANNLFSDGTHIQIAHGQSTYNVCYLSLSLPKGYRFTGYSIKFSKPGQTTKTLGSNSTQFNTENATSTFGETNSTFTTYMTSATVRRGGALDSISRESMSDEDMGNVLYFKMENPTGSRALVTLESAEFFFSAEADYSPLTTPGTVQRVSAIDIPFTTSKVDYGTIQARTYNGVTRPSYSSANVKDIMANFTLYEAGSVKDGADFDGVTGKVVEYKEGSISVEDGYYRIGAADAANPGTDEHIYYIETPSYVLLSDNVTKNPVGYRIVGAKIDYKYGETKEYGTTKKTYPTFYISYSTTGWNATTYYLNSTGGATTTQSDRALWFIDEEGYIRTGVNGVTYLSNYNNQTGGDLYAGTTVNKDDAVKFSISNEGYIYYTVNRTNYWLRRVTSWGNSYFRFQDNTGNRATRTISGETTVDVVDDVIGVTAQPYTLKVYDKTGASAETVEVNESNASGSVYVAGMNNDALKIGVIGTGLIQGTLTLQALDPYLDNMKVICQDEVQEAIRMHQTFTASDFSVSGGEFYFYLPADCENHSVAITFEDLHSKYFDETYTGGSNNHTSRINFVKSDHYNEFGASNNSVYNDIDEAADAQEERLKVGIVGTQKFKFNNAEDLNNGNGVLTEYPFSLENYAAAPNNGTFGEMKFTVTNEDQQLTRYVFTTDETRYNIAPTTAVQHRAYAYYQMIVHVQTATYEPKVKFVKVYDKTLYMDKNGAAQDSAFYGAVITAVDGNGEAGYSSTDEIFKVINAAITAGEDDFGNTDVPDRSQQLLYLDFSQLAGVYQLTTDEHQSMDDYSATNAKNCLIFLPVGATAPNDNVAYKTASGSFRAANNIVLTDKQPFYSPYDIQVGAANYAKFNRQVTVDKYGKTDYVSMILPFGLTTVEGVHTNTTADGCKFKLYQMNENDCLKITQEQVTEGNNYFSSEGLAAQTAFAYDLAPANTPFLVDVTKGSKEDGTIFVVAQEGALVKATSAMGSDYTFTGETGNGTYLNNAISFTNHGGFAGTILDVAGHNQGYYYIGRANKLVCSDNLRADMTELKLLPFRTYYTSTKSGAGSNALMQFNIVFGKNENSDQTGISRIENVKENGAVYDLQGRRVVNPTKGLYIVNGKKVMVK